MSDLSQTVFEGVVTGVAAAAVLGAMVLIRKHIRNMCIYCAIQRDVSVPEPGTALGGEDAGLTVQVKNHGGVEFKVREVVLIAGQFRYHFRDTGEVETSLPQHWAKRCLPKGSSVTGVKYGKQPLSDHAVFPIVRPYTKHRFLLGFDFIRDFKGGFKEVQILIEYRDSDDRVKLINVGTSVKINEYIRREIDRIVSVDKKLNDKGLCSPGCPPPKPDFRATWRGSLSE